MVKIFSTKSTWQMMILRNPLDTLIPKNNIVSFFPNFGSGSLSGLRGLVSGGFFGARHLSPFLDPPPPQVEGPHSPVLPAASVHFRRPSKRFVTTSIRLPRGCQSSRNRLRDRSGWPPVPRPPPLRICILRRACHEGSGGCAVWYSQAHALVWLFSEGAVYGAVIGGALVLRFARFLFRIICFGGKLWS